MLESGYALQRQFRLYIPFLGIARPQPQFPHSCVCERFIYSQNRSTYFLQQKRQTHRGNICIIRSQTHECGNWDWGPDIPFLGIFVSNFRHFVFAVRFHVAIPDLTQHKVSMSQCNRTQRSGMHCLRNASSKGHIVQGTQNLGDTKSQTDHPGTHCLGIQHPVTV